MQSLSSSFADLGPVSDWIPWVIPGNTLYPQLKLEDSYRLTSPMGELVNRLVSKGLEPDMARESVRWASEEDAKEAVSSLAKFGSLCSVRNELMEIGWSGLRVHYALKIAAFLNLHRKLRLS